MDGERQREALLQALRESRQGLDTNELASAVTLHPNTVRWHLGVLGDAGLVEALPEPRRGRGRPSVVYRLTGEGVARDRDDYRLLATMLAEIVADDRDGVARAYKAGVAWGRHLQAAEPDSEVVELLDRQGFEATEAGNAIEMRRCPFYALAAETPGVVCPLHRGVIDGALQHAGSARSVSRLDRFVEPGLCVAHLR
jgi:predicted ArsR family transcriptional regulator